MEEQQIDFRKLMKDLELLRDKSDKYDNLKQYFDEKLEIVGTKLIEAEKMINEAKSIIVEFNPNFRIRKSKDNQIGSLKRIEGNKLESAFREVVLYLREHPSESLTLKNIQEKYNLGGQTICNLKKLLLSNPEIKSGINYSHSGRGKQPICFSIKKEIPSKEIFLSETIKQEKKGDLDIVEENVELIKTLPKKFSVMR